MGVIPDLLEHSYAMERIRTVSGSGRTTSTTDVGRFREATGGRVAGIRYGNPRLAAGFSGAEFEESDGSSGRFFGTFVALSEDFAGSHSAGGGAQ